MLKKKLLFIVPPYMEYWKELEIVLQKEYEITLILDIKKNIEFARKLLKKTYNLLFVIRGTILPYLKDEITQNTTEKKILYEWDSIKNFNYLPFIKLFNSVKTFDLKDAEENGFFYLPLFYSKAENTYKRNIDLLFIGVWHSDRFQLLEKFYNILKKYNKKSYFKLYYKWYYYIPFVILRRIRTFKFYTPKIIPKSKVRELYCSSKVVLDLNHPNQTGYTMRTIEALGNECKLITTNEFIKKSDFYNENNILIIDRTKTIPEEDLIRFLDKPYIKNSNIEKLEITNWVNEVLK